MPSICDGIFLEKITGINISQFYILPLLEDKSCTILAQNCPDLAANNHDLFLEIKTKHSLHNSDKYERSTTNNRFECVPWLMEL